MRRTIRTYRPRRVRHTYGGFSLDIDLADPLAEGWYDHDWPELAEVVLLCQAGLGPGARVFDLGAHQGVVALMLARIVEPNGLVVAVEASSHNYEAALRNRALNHAHALEVRHAAVAEKVGTLFFNLGFNGQVDDGNGEWGQTEVATVSIDSLTADHGPPDVLFLDVEGYELNALRGARETLKRHPSCFVEVHVGAGLERFGGSVPAILAFFPQDAYELFVGTEQQPRPVPLASAGDRIRQRFFLTALSLARLTSTDREIIS